MDEIKKLFAVILAVPLVALMGGVGLWFYKVAESWGQTETAMMMGGLTAACTAGAMALALLLGLIVGVPLALRAYSAAAYSNKRWDDTVTIRPLQRDLPAQRSGQNEWMVNQPPQIAGPVDEGAWRSSGPAAYDLWEGEETPPGDRQ